MKFPLSRVAEFTQASGRFDHAALAEGYSIDTRTVQPGELFFAIKGERLDGHDYVEAALQKGAVAAVNPASLLHRFADNAKGRLAADTTAAPHLRSAAARQPCPAKRSPLMDTVTWK